MERERNNAADRLDALERPSIHYPDRFDFLENKITQLDMKIKEVKYRISHPCLPYKCYIPKIISKYNMSIIEAANHWLRNAFVSLRKKHYKIKAERTQLWML